MNYKPFDLELAKQGHPLVTRDGRTVTEFHHFDTADARGSQPCIYVVDGTIHSCSTNGRYRLADDERDLFLAPVEVTLWVNVGKSAIWTYFTTPTLYETEEEAGNNNYPPIHIATVPVTFTI